MLTFSDLGHLHLFFQLFFFSFSFIATVLPLEIPPELLAHIHSRRAKTARRLLRKSFQCIEMLVNDCGKTTAKVLFNTAV